MFWGGGSSKGAHDVDMCGHISHMVSLDGEQGRSGAGETGLRAGAQTKRLKEHSYKM